MVFVSCLHGPSQAMLGEIAPQLDSCLIDLERQTAADEKALVSGISEAARARKSRWAKFEEDFGKLVSSLREVC